MSEGLLVDQHSDGEVKYKMILDSDKGVGHHENISVELMKKVEILLILMSFIFSTLLILVIISIIM